MKIGRYTRVGLAFGLLLAVGIEIWRQLQISSNGSTEGVGFNAFLLAVAAGFPASIVTALSVDVLAPLLDWVPGMDFQYMMLAGVVVNWTLLGYGIDRLVFGRTPKSLPRTGGVEASDPPTVNRP